MIIKNEDIFSAISKVSYVLALSNEPVHLIEMVLDELLQALNIDCCWVQFVRPEDRNLQLIACRGFTPKMTREIDLVDSSKTLGNRVVMGLKVIIADLSRDGEYGLSSFRKAGLRSLVAVPMRTYRTHGVMGIASRTEKRFSAEDAELLMVIAGLVSAAVNIAELSKIALATREKRSIAQNQTESEPSLEDDDIQSYLDTESEDVVDCGGASETAIEKQHMPLSTSDENVDQEPAAEEDIGQYEEVAAKTGELSRQDHDEMGVSLRPLQVIVHRAGKEGNEMKAADETMQTAEKASGRYTVTGHRAKQTDEASLRAARRASNQTQNTSGKPTGADESLCRKSEEEGQTGETFEKHARTMVAFRKLHTRS